MPTPGLLSCRSTVSDVGPRTPVILAMTVCEARSRAALAVVHTRNLFSHELSKCVPTPVTVWADDEMVPCWSACVRLSAPLGSSTICGLGDGEASQEPSP